MTEVVLAMMNTVMLTNLLMPRKTIDKDAEAIATLPWVESVTKKVGPRGGTSESYGYTVKTKPGELKVIVTHGIAKNGEYHYIGKALKKPIQVPMPSLTLHVAPSRYGVTVKMSEKPTEIKLPRFLPFPSWDGSGLDLDNWDYPGCPCWGDYYDYPREYMERAQYIAEYLQHSMPHRSEHRGGSRYAFALGLLPEEYVVEDPKANDDTWIDEIEEHYDGDMDDDDMCNCHECRADREDDDDWEDDTTL